MSLSVFIIFLLTCSNLCNCALPVPVHVGDVHGHPENDEHKNNNDVYRKIEQVSLDDLVVKGYVQDNRKAKKHIENKPENVPQHVNDLQTKNSAHGNPEEKEQTQNKPEIVPPHVDNLEISAHGNPEEKEQIENKAEIVPPHVDNLEDSAQSKPENDQTKNKPENVPPRTNEKKPVNVINSSKNVTINIASKPNHEIRSHKKINHNVTEMDSSTLKRLVLVLVALSILFIMYLAFKTYRGRNRKSRMMVSKYGVRTRRSDLEMRPLPLDEEEEDETVFEVGNVNNR